LQTFGLADFHLPQTDSSTGGTLLPRCSPPGTPPRSTDLRLPALKSGSYPLCCIFCLSFVWFLSAQTISSLDSKRRSHVNIAWRRSRALRQERNEIDRLGDFGLVERLRPQSRHMSRK